MRVLFVCSFFFAISGCEHIGTAGDDVVVTVRPASIVISNLTGDRIFFQVFGRETAARINWAPTVSDGGGIFQGESEEIEFGKIYRSEQETQALVYWWHAVRNAGKLEPGDIHPIVINVDLSPIPELN